MTHLQTLISSNKLFEEFIEETIKEFIDVKFIFLNNELCDTSLIPGYS